MKRQGYRGRWIQSGGWRGCGVGHSPVWMTRRLESRGLGAGWRRCLCRERGLGSTGRPWPSLWCGGWSGVGTQVIKYVRAFGEREKAGSETPKRVYSPPVRTLLSMVFDGIENV